MVGEIIETVLIWAIVILVGYFDCKFDPNNKSVYVIWLAITVLLYTIWNIVEIIQMFN